MKTFQGGPLDGHPLADDDSEYPVHTFDWSEHRMLVYIATGDGEYIFSGIVPMDEYAKEQQDDKGQRD